MIRALPRLATVDVVKPGARFHGRSTMNKQRGVIAEIYLYGLALIALSAAVWGLHHYVYQQGYDAAEAKWQKINADATIGADEKLAEKNAEVRKAQSELTAFMASLADKQKELNDAKATSAALQSDLAAGRVRLRVLTTSHALNRAGQDSGPAAAAVDTGAEVTEDLAPSVAAGLERLRANENEAIDRLNGCIEAYEAVGKALQ